MSSGRPALGLARERWRRTRDAPPRGGEGERWHRDRPLILSHLLRGAGGGKEQAERCPAGHGAGESDASRVWLSGESSRRRPEPAQDSEGKPLRTISVPGIIVAVNRPVVLTSNTAISTLAT